MLNGWCTSRQDQVLSLPSPSSSSSSAYADSVFTWKISNNMFHNGGTTTDSWGYPRVTYLLTSPLPAPGDPASHEIIPNQPAENRLFWHFHCLNTLRMSGHQAESKSTDTCRNNPTTYFSCELYTLSSYPKGAIWKFRRDMWYVTVPLQCLLYMQYSTSKHRGNVCCTNSTSKFWDNVCWKYNKSKLRCYDCWTYSTSKLCEYLCKT